MLAPADEKFLRDKGLTYEAGVESGLVCLVIKAYRLPPGYDPAATDLLLRLPPGFPDAQPDMFWCDPPIRIAASGAYPQAADQMEPYLGRIWQRFSRHLGPGVWEPGRDNLGSFMALIGAELERSLQGPR